VFGIKGIQHAFLVSTHANGIQSLSKIKVKKNVEPDLPNLTWTGTSQIADLTDLFLFLGLYSPCAPRSPLDEGSA